MSVLWSRPAEKSGNEYRGVVDAAGRFRMKRHRTEADKSWPIHATGDGESRNNGKMEGEGGEGVPIQLWKNAKAKWYIV